MTVLALVSEKGGGGKTTVAVHLAAEWHRQGLQVLLADCDPQESASTWADLAESLGHPAPPVVSLGDSPGKQVRDLAPKYDVVLLDTPGHRSDRMARALAVADLVVVPVRSGQQDLWSLARTVEAVKLANNTRYGLAASIWTENINLALDLAPKIKAGVIWINCSNVFDAAAGFGGYRESGFGREGG